MAHVMIYLEGLSSATWQLGVQGALHPRSLVKPAPDVDCLAAPVFFGEPRSPA
jgi:hypothetical protein